ncbi:Y-family DNA polymerase [Acidovorax delafieldii]|uniref:Y-family DNA polymerase n=1 Tax=Acidovorax delafieldii TaxID=47920 RepID=UPI003ED09809
MHWIALPLPWCGEAVALAGTGTDRNTGVLNAAAGWWALRFTPRVALADGEAVLLEVSTTERLWGGRDALQALVLQAWADASARCEGEGVAPPPVRSTEEPAHSFGATTAPVSHAPTVWGTGPTALVAHARLRMALAGRICPPEGRAENLPLHTLTALRPHVASLERMGCRTWGALRALPRAGVARRLGAGVLQVLDQALGDAPEAHAWLQLPEQFVLTTELPALAESADALLWSASRSLTALQAWLQARQQGVLALELAWRHDLRRLDGVALPPTQALQVRTAQATHDLVHLRRLLAENLARTSLAAPVNQITLRLLESAPLPHRSASLLPPGEVGGRDPTSHGSTDPAGTPGEALHQLLERLSARLGADHVVAPVLLADHRPERMQQWRPATEWLGTPARSAGPHAAGGAPQGIAPDASLLPTWLLNPPRQLAVQGNRPCHHGLLRLLAGPHRLEAGWWSAMDDGVDPAPHCADLALRDYFVAYNDVAGLVWVFRERLAPALDGTPAMARPHRWFLHGIFG